MASGGGRDAFARLRVSVWAKEVNFSFETAGFVWVSSSRPVRHRTIRRTKNTNNERFIMSRSQTASDNMKCVSWLSLM